MSDKISKVKINELPSSESINDEDVFIESNSLETYKVAADDVAKYVSLNEHMTEKYVQSDLIGESDGIAPLNSSQKVDGQYIIYGTETNTAYEGSSGKMLEQRLESLQAAIGTKVNTSELRGHVSNTAIHTAASEKELWNTVSCKANLTDLEGKADLDHTHNYAGSSSPGGSAYNAVRLDTSAGSATTPVYFSDGKPVACTYTLGKSVPSDAVFTDTKVTIDSALSSTSTNPVQNKVMNSALDTLNTEITAIKKSVSDGKSAVANAITAQGVTTAADATFDTMAANVTAAGNARYNAGVTAAKLGNATAANVLSGKTFTNASTVGLTGTMADYSANPQTVTLSSTQTGTSTHSLSAGYHSSVKVNAANVYNAGVAAGHKMITGSFSIPRGSAGSIVGLTFQFGSIFGTSIPKFGVDIRISSGFDGAYSQAPRYWVTTVTATGAHICYCASSSFDCTATWVAAL